MMIKFVTTVIGTFLLAPTTRALSLNDNAAFDAFVASHELAYDRRHCMGLDDSEFCILWKIHADREIPQIELAVAAVVGDGTGESGWLGFGIAEAGGMPGSDIVVYEVATNTFKDYFSLAYASPIEDSCDSDWVQQGEAVVEDGFVAVRLVRALDTEDSQDRVIFNDADLTLPATAIIAAWGEEETLSYHGKSRARSVVRFFTPDTDTSSITATSRSADTIADPYANAASEKLQDMADGSFVIYETSDYTIPSVETTYFANCINVTEYLTQEQIDAGVYIIGAEYVPSIETVPDGTDNVEWVHHMVGQATFGECAPPGQRNSLLTLFTWAPGGQPLVLPDNVHFKVGGSDGFLGFGNNIHFDNRNGVEGIRDYTGVRWYYVNKAREHQAGVIYAGDAIVGLGGQPVGAGPTKHSFSCPGTCSAAIFGDEPSVTVFIEALHEHETGVRVVSEVKRDGQVVHSASVENFDFPINGLQPVQQDSYTIYPGDSFHTTCYYDNVDNSTVFGLGSQEEMCHTLIYYYPAHQQNQAYCGPGYPDPRCAADYEVLPTDDTFDRAFGVAPVSCPDKTTDPSSSKPAGVTLFAVAGTAASLMLAVLW